MSELQVLGPRERGVFQRRAQALRSFQRGEETITAAATYIFPIGVVDVPGLVLERFFVATGSALVPDGTNYYTFKPWMYRMGADGNLVKVYLGTGRSTLALGILAGEAFRLHDEQNLKAEAPPGAVVGVDLVVTMVPAAASRLIFPVFQADLYAR